MAPARDARASGELPALRGGAVRPRADRGRGSRSVRGRDGDPEPVAPVASTDAVARADGGVRAHAFAALPRHGVRELGSRPAPGPSDEHGADAGPPRDRRPGQRTWRLEHHSRLGRSDPVPRCEPRPDTESVADVACRRDIPRMRSRRRLQRSSPRSAPSGSERRAPRRTRGRRRPPRSGPSRVGRRRRAERSDQGCRGTPVPRPRPRIPGARLPAGVRCSQERLRAGPRSQRELALASDRRFRRRAVRRRTCRSRPRSRRRSR